MTVEQNRLQAAQDRIHGQIRERAGAMLDVRMRGAPGAAHQLSGGQRQRVALARSLVKRPKPLLSTSRSRPSTRSCASTRSSS